MDCPRSRSRFTTGTIRAVSLLGIFAVGLSSEPWAGGGQTTTPQVLYSGCKVIRDTPDGMACMPNSDGKMVVWVGVASCDAVRLEEDGRTLPAASQFVQDGCQFKVVADSLNAISSLTVANQQTGQRWWTLRLDRTKPDLLKWTRRVMDRRDPDLAEVTAELRRKESQESQIETVMDYTYASAWVHRRLGQLDLAIREYREVVELAKKAHYPSIAFEAQYRLANTLRQFGQTQEAKAALREAEALVTPGHGKDKIDFAYHTANIFQDEENRVAAIKWFQEAHVDAERIDYREKLRITTLCLAELYTALDSLPDAKKLLNTVDPLLVDASDCEKAPLLALQGWVSLQLAQTDTVPGVSPTKSHTGIKNIFFAALKAEEQCKNYQSLSNIYANLAETAFLEGNFAEAQTWINKAFTVPWRIVLDELELLNLEARLALHAGRPDSALLSLKKMDDLSRNRLDLKRGLLECTIALGTLESFRALGQQTAAVSDRVRACLENKNGSLSPSDIRNLHNRAKALGIEN